MIDFGREACSDLVTAERREWLVTNGIGGYASGTVAGVLTRRYHGLLVAALQPPVGRTLLLTKLDEAATYAGRSYPLFANRWAQGDVEPCGFHHLQRFHLEGTIPVWTFACADALLEKRIWMAPGANTTYVRYHLTRASGPVELHLKAIVNHRDHHGNTRAGELTLSVESVDHGLLVTSPDDNVALTLRSDNGQATLDHVWYRGYHLALEAYRGLNPVDDNLYAGCFRATLQPGDSVTVVASTSLDPVLDGAAALVERRSYEEGLLAQSGLDAAPASIRHLMLAADQFVVRRPLPDESDGLSVIAGYHWFSDWGRDTMIALPGLALATGRADVAARILRTFAHFVDRGMLPNRFPDRGEPPEYNTVDATLWLFEAIRTACDTTGGDCLLRDLFPVLQEIVGWHVRGTRYGIGLDPADGLLRAGEPGVQLTWMDAKVDDWVVTPRTGKPVEINALWYNALRCMAGFARRLDESPDRYEELAGRARVGFERFWNAEADYCYDVIDGPNGDDPALRPNQLFAVSLPHSPLTPEQQRAVVDACSRHLLTAHGLRSLAPDDPAYVGRYGGGRHRRDAAYHQGTVWGWLIGPFVTAHLRVHRDPQLARSFLAPLLHQLATHGVGSLSEIFDGDPPFTPRGCIAQAWTVAEVLRAWRETERG
jgi:predicted glycogen debranching enzyme